MPVFRPGAPNVKLYLAEGLRYRLLDEKDGEVFVQPLPFVIEENDTIKIGTSSSKLAVEAFVARTEDLKAYNRAWQQGLAWSTLLLPIKMRPSVEKDGVKYEKDITTDVAIGPFLGYKFAMGRSYRQFMHLGGFAGPTVIRLTTATADTTSGTADLEASNNVGWSYGLGIMYEMRDLQIGFVWGKDQIGGTAAKEWAWNGKPWVSFAIGYSFLSNQR